MCQSLQGCEWWKLRIKGHIPKNPYKKKKLIQGELLMVTMKDLLECGVHFGHQTRRWNSKWKKFIFGVRKNIYIIDLQKTLRYFRYTYNVVRDRAAEGQNNDFRWYKKNKLKKQSKKKKKLLFLVECHIC